MIAKNEIITRTASVLIADPISGVRPIIAETVRELGFVSVMSVESLKDALGILETDTIDWLICSVFKEDERANILQLLSVARKQHLLENLKVSILVSEEEVFLLPKAFSLGLLSYHLKPITKESLKKEFDDLMKTITASNENLTLTAASYLRERLKAEDLPNKLVDLEKGLVQAFPENASLLLRLAEAHFRNNEETEARILLWQALERDAKLEGKVQELNIQYPPSKEVKSGQVIGTCLVVDPDVDIQSSIKDTLNSIGVEDVLTFSDGESCWDWLKDNDEPELLIAEWRIPKLPTHLLVQRCRANAFHSMSIIIHSSLVDRKQRPLLVEMGVSTVLPKPFRKEDFVTCLVATLSDSNRPTEVKSLERKIRSELASNKLNEAINLMHVFLSKAKPKDKPLRLQLEAEIEYKKSNYTESRNLAASAIRMGNNSIILLNLLGKALMKLGDFSSALKAFQKANEVSPDSIERLCRMAEAQQELGESGAATDTLNQASEIDPENQTVVNTSVRVGIAIGNSNLVEKNYDKFRPTGGVFAYVNNKAVAYAKSGKFDESIKIYQNALASIPSDDARLFATIKYNLGLAYARKGESQPIIDLLSEIKSLDDEGFFRKIKSLLNRAQDSVATGEPMKLFVAPESENIETVGSFDIERQTSSAEFESTEVFCCVGIYDDDGGSDPKIKEMLSKELNFKARGALKMS